MPHEPQTVALDQTKEIKHVTQLALELVGVFDTLRHSQANAMLAQLTSSWLWLYVYQTS